MRGNCFESQQIWWSEIRADDGGGGVIRIRAEGGLERVEGGGGWWWWLVGAWGGLCALKEVLGGVGSICTHSVTVCVCVHLTPCVCVCVCVCVCRSWIFFSLSLP